jgi:hypothetical protein
MKRFFLFLLLLPVFILGVANAQNPAWPGDTLGITAVINFEDPAEYILNDSSGGNIWQIGEPRKYFFQPAYTPPNAIVTDTLNPYPVNNFSTFTLIVGYFNDFWYPWEVFVDFRHKFDTDTLKDGGFIQISYDNGASWINIIHDTMNYEWFVTPAQNTWLGGFGNTNLYDTSDVLTGGNFGYSGNSWGWVHTSIAWYNIPVDGMFLFPDTLRIRFCFISDSIPEIRAGWMIDQIRLFGIDLGSGIPVAEKPRIAVIPNPVQSDMEIRLDAVHPGVAWRILDLRGVMIQQGEAGSVQSFSLNRTGLNTGLYLLEIRAQDGFAGTRRILVRD